jgi:methionyl-tRNA formyltransferase
VKSAALELGLPVTDRVEDVLTAGADLGVVVAYGRLIRRPLLERLGFVNLHFSLLPRWRGAAPVERALLAGDRETGVCLMQLEEGLDTGPVFAHRRVPIDIRVTADALRRQLVELGSELLTTTLVTGLRDPVPQAGEATYAAKLTSADLEVHWGADAEAIDRLVRVGGAWTTWRGRRLKLLDAEPITDHDATGASPAPGTLTGDGVVTGSGQLRLLTVQPEGKGPMLATAWRHGAHPGPGERLGV